MGDAKRLLGKPRPRAVIVVRAVVVAQDENRTNPAHEANGHGQPNHREDAVLVAAQAVQHANAVGTGGHHKDQQIAGPSEGHARGQHPGRPEGGRPDAGDEKAAARHALDGRGQAGFDDHPRQGQKDDKRPEQIDENGPQRQARAPQPHRHDGKAQRDAEDRRAVRQQLLAVGSSFSPPEVLHNAPYMVARRPQPQKHHDDHGAHGLMAQQAHGRPLKGVAEDVEVFGAQDADAREEHLLRFDQQVEEPQAKSDVGMDQIGQSHPHAVEAQVKPHRVVGQRQRVRKVDAADELVVVAQGVDPVQDKRHG